MTPELYTFKNLIGAHFSINGEDSVRIDEIIIPRIQRDYAQGRIGASENRVRERFLDALYESIYEQGCRSRKADIIRWSTTINNTILALLVRCQKRED